MDSSLAQKNAEYFELLTKKYPHLQEVSLINNKLFFLEYSVDLNNFSLESLKEETFYLYPFDILNIIKIHTDISEEINFLKENDYNANFLYIEIRTILIKQVLNNVDIEKLNRFIDIFILLKNHQDYLVDDALTKYNYMQNVIRDNLYIDNTYTTPGITLLTERINESNQSKSNDKGMRLSLVNPKYPGTYNSDEDQISYQKSGYASTMLLIYIVINIGFILAVMLIK